MLHKWTAVVVRLESSLSLSLAARGAGDAALDSTMRGPGSRSGSLGLVDESSGLRKSMSGVPREPAM